MKATIILTLILTLIMSSLCLADDAILQKAYALFYKGDREAAVDMVENYVQDNPDAKAFYFLGYAYYEMKQLDKSREYFNEAYSLESFYSPMASTKDQ